jgi:hypothetical protein
VLITSLGHTLRTGQKRHAKPVSQLKDPPLIIMKLHFILSLACAGMSFLAILGLSAMTVVPEPEAESTVNQMMLIAGAFMVAWLCLAFWLHSRIRVASASPLPRWLSRLLICMNVLFLLGVCLFVIG